MPGLFWNSLRSRRPAYVSALAILFLIGLALGHFADVRRALESDDLDHRVWRWAVQHRDSWQGLTALFLWVTRLGDWPFGLAFVVAGAWLLWILERRGASAVGHRAWIFWLGAALGSRLLSLGLKAWFQRERPLAPFRLVAETSFSFPSSHSLSSATCFAVAGVLIARSLGRNRVWHRNVLVGVCVLIPLLIGASRVWLGVHYLSDVVNGWLLGSLWGLLACAIHFDWLSLRKRPGTS